MGQYGLHAVLQKTNQSKKLVAAICFGSVTLAKAGVIGDGDIAYWYNAPSSDAQMDAKGVVDSNQNVTIADHIITGDGPSAADEFAEAIVLCYT